MFRGSVHPLIAALLLGTPAAGLAQVTKIAADPQKGFQWPYYLYTPAKVKQPAVLMVEPNNSGRTDDDPAVHDALAQSLLDSERPYADDLGVPYLVPTFPRPDTYSTTYTHALDRNTILSTLPGLQRIDLQLIAMTQDARAHLAASGINVDPKFFMIGASASGSFVSRFIMLHPDAVKAASIGTPGSGPIVPVASFNGQTLLYPYGIADLEQLVGTKFDQQSFRNVPLQVWVGDDDHNMDEYWTPHNPDVVIISPAFGGDQLYQRWPKYETAYASVSSRCQFIIFPGMGHTWADWSYIKEFFERNRTEPFPSPLPKPRLYKLYFPHVASFGPWETEIALTNTAEVPVHGDLQAYRADGTPLNQSIPVTLPALGRNQIVVGSALQSPEEIAYLAFLSDSGFIAGYTRFSQPGNRTSLAAGTGVKQGWFPKMEKDGWTGIAFVNTETSDATVDLTASDENGVSVATKTLPLRPGEKFVGMVNQLFPTDLTNAKYFKFKSDRNVLGFTVSGSSDGQMLDGLHCLDNYIYVK